MPIPDRIVAEAFSVLARVRHARVFHPEGLPLTGALHAVDDDYARIIGARDKPVLARMSKATSMPGGIPDALGLAVRVLDWQNRPWDLALATTGTGALGRFVLRPVRSWAAARYGSLMAYSFFGGPPEWVFAEPDHAQPQSVSLEALCRFRDGNRLGFVLRAASLLGPARTLAEITVSRPEIGEHAAPGFFDPVLNLPQEVELLPRAVASVREWAYAGSRRGRGERAPVAEEGLAAFQGREPH
ncbi:phosphodiesterase [Nocardia sp. CDC159]|uniref:Phosphodiesterase n=1 Tax=Nocardia pulmonis TaxID=2951408 RepID=A0A9X2IZC0_9NOCA|nr:MULTISPECIES: phosphodiesterase [Nocardia]MCM6775855.1 phosphodiesterase [Nocardia pulmonis]MCM6788169.1 phosphodiesterase [Nocardia sp. CDC159]